MTDFVDERYKTKQGLRWWPETELVRFIGKTYGHTIDRDQSNGWALDIGCGTGRNAWLLSEAGFEVNAIDDSADAIGLAKEYMVQRRRTGVYCDVAAWPEGSKLFADTVFDLAVDVQTTQHLSWLDRETSYKEVARVLKTGGLFWMMTWAGRPEAANAIYAGCYPELDVVYAGEIREILRECGLACSSSSYLVTREYPDVCALAEWLIIEAVKP